MNMSNSFDHLPRTAQSHFTLHFFAAIYALLHFVRHTGPEGISALDDLLEEHPFLEGYFAQILERMPEEINWRDGLEWWQTQIAIWEAGQPLPFVTLSNAMDLDFMGRIALSMTGLVEEDARFGPIFDKLQPTTAGQRPMVQLLHKIAILSNRPVAGEVCQMLLAAGLLEPVDPEQPRAAWIVRVPLVLWDLLRTGALAESDWLEFQPASAFPQTADLLMPEAFREQIGRLPRLLLTGQTNVVILRGSQGSDRARVAGSLARAGGYNVVSFSGPALVQTGPALEKTTLARQLPAICALLHAVPVVEYDLGPGESATLDSLVHFKGPMFVLLGKEGGLKGKRAAGAVTVNLPRLRSDQRLAHWQGELGQNTGDDLDDIVERFHLPARYIRRAATLALSQAALNQREAVTIEDVRVACRTLNRQQLDSLAAAIQTGGTWQQLVVRETASAKLHELERRCRHRERLGDYLAPIFAANHHSGVRALFTGASGTGKTMAARILASELGIDLYRVDLAATVNKYIGETEKNLHRILSRAEALDVILLFDEADALLGNRTEVRSANDRYANLETNYLLQRLEHYRGIVLFTSNLSENIDPAFRRRMDAVIDFVPPQAQERLLIWRLHLPDDHTVPGDYLGRVAAACQLTGGQIRNGAIFATLMALDEGQPIGRHHLDQALYSEYRKAGAVCPIQPDQPGTNGNGRVSDFVNSFVT